MEEGMRILVAEVVRVLVVAVVAVVSVVAAKVGGVIKWCCVC